MKRLVYSFCVLPTYEKEAEVSGVSGRMMFFHIVWGLVDVGRRPADRLCDCRDTNDGEELEGTSHCRKPGVGA